MRVMVSRRRVARSDCLAARPDSLLYGIAVLVARPTQRMKGRGGKGGRLRLEQSPYQTGRCSCRMDPEE